MTKIWAILSDVHGRGRPLEACSGRRRSSRRTHVLALGDIGDVRALTRLIGPGQRVCFGNWEASGLRGLPSVYRGWVGRWPAAFRGWSLGGARQPHLAGGAGALPGSWIISASGSGTGRPCSPRSSVPNKRVGMRSLNSKPRM